MWPDIFYWTGAVVWVALGGAIGWILALLTRDAIFSAWHVARVYRHGWIRNPDRSWMRSLGYPFRMWAYFFIRSPKYIDRVDEKGGRIWRPNANAPYVAH